MINKATRLAKLSRAASSNNARLACVDRPLQPPPEYGSILGRSIMAGTDRRRWVWESKGSRSKDMTLVVGNYHPNYSTDVLIHKRDKKEVEYFKIP